MKSISILAAITALGFSTAAQAAGPSDAQIAAIVVTANQVDIDAGKLAQARAHRRSVRDFARLMVNDHSGVNAQAVALAGRLHVTPEANSTSQGLQAGGDANLAQLKSLKGAKFDAAYVAHEVAYHEQVLGAIDSVLIPSAQNAELKNLLVTVRPAFAAHLEHARQVQASLGAAPAAK